MFVFVLLFSSSFVNQKGISVEVWRRLRTNNFGLEVWFYFFAYNAFFLVRNGHAICMQWNLNETPAYKRRASSVAVAFQCALIVESTKSTSGKRQSVVRSSGMVVV